MTDDKHHIISIKTYLMVFISLLLLTVLTVLASMIDFGSFNIVLALLIASFKSSLVLLFFMHLYYDNKINLIFILGSVLFLALFIGITMLDVTKRTDFYEIEGDLVNPRAIMYKTTSDGHPGH
tara:strand:- start:347 stop:715 length:369 start_codon:yes stop_codon:yes gene_type:complete